MLIGHYCIFLLVVHFSYALMYFTILDNLVVKHFCWLSRILIAFLLPVCDADVLLCIIDILSNSFHGYIVVG